MNTTKTYGADGTKFGHTDQDAIERFGAICNRRVDPLPSARFGAGAQRLSRRLPSREEGRVRRAALTIQPANEYSASARRTKPTWLPTPAALRGVFRPAAG